jgi:transcriptional regulator with XRE-family HTH domain
VSDNELGAFLRTRREALTPAEVGLPTGTRRRTPGLRRAELATLAGISVDYLVRLEQGRDRHPSGQVLGALADALRLSADERFHLRLLTKVSAGDGHLLCPASGPAQSVRPAVQALLDQLEPAPALVANRLNDVLAYTTGYARLARPVGILEAQRPNLSRFVFTDSRARAVYPDWDRVADEQVANLRLEFHRADPYLAAFVDELAMTAGASFSERVAAPSTPPTRTGVERFRHPDQGELLLTYEILTLADADDQRLVVYLPADDATSAALDQLTGRQPGALRVVSG